jgi:hypothetical protein
MWVHLKNGRSFYFADAMTIWRQEDELHVRGKRKVRIATFHCDAVASYYSSDVDVTTYTAKDIVDRMEIPE